MVQINAKVMVGWLIFINVYSHVWDSGISNMMAHASKITRRVTATAPLERAYLLVVWSYTACRATLLVALYMLLMFCVMGCVQCVTPFLAHMKRVHAAMTWMFAEDVLFRPMIPKILPFHGAVLVSCLVLAAVYSVVYTSDADLVDPDKCTSVLVKAGLSMPLIGLCAYLGIALFQSTITPP